MAAPHPDIATIDTPAAPAGAAVSPWLHRFAILLVIATFALIAVGGNVTSLDAGLAVPDGFYTFGYPSLVAPPDVWWHELGTRWEHSHRLMGYLVGAMSIAIAVWLWLTQKHRPWLRRMGVVFLLMVIVQGVMGILRVDQVSTGWAMVHGFAGQVLLCIAVLIAAATSRVWFALAQHPRPEMKSRLTRFSLFVVALLLLQLLIGVAVRHQGAGLAIPDFPTSFGKVIPPMTQAQIDEAVVNWPADENVRPATVAQVHLQFLHRVTAFVIVAVALWYVPWVATWRPGRTELVAPWVMFAGLLALQFMLGVMNVWTWQTPPQLATYHQSCGAALLATSVWLAIRIHLVYRAPGSGTREVAATEVEKTIAAESALA